MIFLIFRIFMNNLNGLCGFYHDLPWGSLCLGRVNLAYSRTTVKIPKFLGAASKHYVTSLEHLHPTPANIPFHLILQHDTVTPALRLLYWGPFCSGHFNPFKSFFFREIFNSHLFWLNSHPAAFLDHDQGLLNLNIRRIQDLIEVGRVWIYPKKVRI
jgi:hypothetical protein